MRTNGINDTGGKFAVDFVDTIGKFAASINNTSETGGKICRQCRWYRGQFCPRCRWYRRQFCRRCHWQGWQICHRCRWYRWCTLTCEYLRKFSKKFETALWNTLGLGGNWFMKNTRGKKSRDTVPLMCVSGMDEWTIKTPNPICLLFFKIDLFLVHGSGNRFRTYKIALPPQTKTKEGKGPCRKVPYRSTFLDNDIWYGFLWV